jgi:predicted outer membrane repeat protein
LSGGGILSQGGLTVTHSTFSGNTAESGGGIYSTGTALLSNVTFIGNRALGGSAGGGLYFGTTGNVTVTDSVLASNTATGTLGYGGAIYIESPGTDALLSVTLSSNSAKVGGGIYTIGTATLSNSTLSGNSAIEGGGIDSLVSITLNAVKLIGNAASYGGGMNHVIGTATLTNTTFSSNTAANRGGGISNNGSAIMSGLTLLGNSADSSGGIYNSNRVTLSNSTLSGNSTSNQGGGIYNSGSMALTNVTLHNRASLTGMANNLYLNVGVIILTNTIVDFAASFGTNCFGGGAPKSGSGGHNAANDTSCGLTATGDQQGPNVQILLGPLANHSGPTLTQLPRHGSAAIDHGDNAVCAAAPISNLDQRGVLRPLDGNGAAIAICDIGAVERQPSDSDLVPWIYLPLIQR